jgi:hypothetical protein
MKMLLLLITLLVAIRGEVEPEPVGGANCIDNYDCGGANAGKCVNDTCECPPWLANRNCSYHRYGAELPGGLNIALPFVFVGGIGNFIIHNVGRGVGQILLTLAPFIVLIPVSIIIGIGSIKEFAKKPTWGIGAVIMIGAIIAGLGGFVWSIIDGSEMLEGKLTDGNGYNLYRNI